MLDYSIVFFAGGSYGYSYRDRYHHRPYHMKHYDDYDHYRPYYREHGYVLIILYFSTVVMEPTLWVQKKTLKCCCTSRGPLAVLVSCDVVTSCHDVIWRHNVMQSVQLVCVHWNQQTMEITFLTLVTLTFDLWPWPSNLSKISSRSIPVPNSMTACQTV